MGIPYIKKFKRILQRKRIYRQTKSRWAGEQGYTVPGGEHKVLKELWTRKLAVP